MRPNTLNKKPHRAAPGCRSRSESGFSILEMTVALIILMVGLLTLASSVGYALMVSNSGRNVTNTKLLVASVLEQMENLRNTKELTFGQIANTGSYLHDATGATRTFNGFQTGFQPVSTVPGPDGIYGTSDDMLDPGPDNLFGTADDTTNGNLAYTGYYREIVITQVAGNTNLRRIQVTIRYPGGDGRVRSITGVSYLNNDARSNFLP